MGSYQTGISPRCAITSIRNRSTESPIKTSPVIAREEIVVFVERWSRLIFDELQNRVNGVVPVGIQDGGVFGILIV